MTIRKSLRKSLIIFPIVGSILLNPINVKAQLGDSVLEEGIVHEDVKILKEKLVDLNFLIIEEDKDINKDITHYDKLTVQAVKDFQNFYGLEEDGSFDLETFETFEKVLKNKPLEYTRILKPQVKGEDVQALQEKLQMMGFLFVNEVGKIYGPKTEKAVSDFQKVYKLKVDGIAGPDTIEAINNALTGKNRIRRPGASRGTSPTRSIDNDIIATAKKYIGIPYRYAGTSPSGFDCSGFTQFVYNQHKISVPRSSLAQAGFGTILNRDELRTGDLVIFSNTYRQGPSHVGIYIGNGDVIHSGCSKGITIDNIDSGYYLKHYSYGRRVY